MGYFRRMFLDQKPRWDARPQLWYKNGWISDGVTYGHKDLFRIGPTLMRALPKDDFDTQLYMMYPKQPSAKADVNDVFEASPRDADHSRYYASMTQTDSQLDKCDQVFWTNFVYQQRPEHLAYRIGYYYHHGTGDRQVVYLDQRRYAPEANYWICEEHTHVDWSRPCFVGCVRLQENRHGYRRRYNWTDRRDAWGYRRYLFLVMGCHWEEDEYGPTFAERERITELILHT